MDRTVHRRIAVAAAAGLLLLFTEAASAFFCFSFGAGGRSHARSTPATYYGPPVYAAPWPANSAPPPSHYYGGQPAWPSRNCPTGKSNTGYGGFPSFCPTH